MNAVMEAAEWRERAQAHARRADALTAARRDRAARGVSHAVDDFLFEYYGVRPARLRRWHPGVGVTLRDAPEHAAWRWYTSDAVGTSVDAAAFVRQRGATVDFVTGLVGATLRRRAALGCFGLHEWAMVYRDGTTRHDLPLRLGAAGTDEVVAAHDVVCTHFDAFRFFTPEAAPRNAHALTRETQTAMEQPGCLHATMDLVKWCLKLSPAVPSDLLLDCWELAVQVRRLDMAASPYDVREFGLKPVRIETPEGKREYAARQREFAAHGEALRRRLLNACDAIRTAAARSAPASGVAPADASARA